MARFLACADTNFTTLSTWDTVDSTSLLDSEAGNTALTTSYVESSSFTPGAITIDGIAVKLASRAASPTGTMSVRLALAGATVTGTEVAINVSDLPTAGTSTNEGGWVLFQFSSVLLSAATAYTVSAKTSSASMVNIYRNATAGNWSRLLRTITNPGSLAAGDTFDIVQEYTGAGTATARTVTMDETATTDYGAGTDGVVALTISKGGTLSYGTTAATNYYLKLSGDLIIYNGGTLNVGTTGTAIPRDSTAVLELDPVADGGMGLIARNGSTLNIQGLSRTVGKNVIACKLNTDEAVSSTLLGVDTDTGWLDNDEIVVASTTRTATETEKGTLNGNAGASSLTVDGFGGTGGGLAYAHSGTSPTQGEIILLTRNVKVRSATSTLMTYVYLGPTATVDIDYTEFYYLGENSAGKRGIEIATTTGSCSIQYSSLHDCEDLGIYPVSVSVIYTFSNNVAYNLNSSATNALLPSFNGAAATVVNGNILLLIGGAINADQNFILVSPAGTFTNNVIAGVDTGSSNSAIRINGQITGTISGNTIHSCTGRGLEFGSATDRNIGGTISSTTIWRCGSYGLYVLSVSGCVFNTVTIFGNATANISASGFVIFKSVIANGDAVYASAVGLEVGSGDIWVLDSSFGATTAHTTADVRISTVLLKGKCVLINSTLASTTETSSPGAACSAIQSHKHDASSTTFKNWYKYGIIASDQTTRHTASGYSWKPSPSSASYKLILPGPTIYDTFKAAVNADTAVTITAWVRKDATYNGNAPRLVLVGGLINGIASDVTDSLTVGADTWEQLSVSGTPTEAGCVDYYIDCDGTAGNVYVDDASISQA